MGTWRDEILHRKYDPLPEEPRHRKKSRKTHIRSDHKHDYEDVAIDTNVIIMGSDGKKLRYNLAKRCTLCGRLKDWKMYYLEEPPDGMPIYRTTDWYELWKKMVLPSELKVRQ